MRRSAILLGLLVLAGVSYGDTIRVPSDYPTIQAGIDAAADGDTVLAADGTYTGSGNYDIDLKGKAITAMSENGSDVTIIDCEGAGRGFYFHSGEDDSSRIEGFTVINGFTIDDGGGIYCRNYSSPTIVNCVIAGNTADKGGGICCGRESSPTVVNCTIAGNSATNGGGICLYGDSSPTFTNCILWYNNPEEIYVYSAELNMTYSDIQDGWSGEGNISKNPLFEDPLIADFMLQADSPCIDTGDPSFNPPLGGGAHIDMGAYEYWHGFNFEVLVNPLPSIQVSPDSFSLFAADDESLENETLIIMSIGEEPLEYAVTSGGESWLTLSGETEGILIPNDSAEVILEFDTSPLEIGFYNDTLIITSNDPHNLSTDIPVQLTIFSHGVLNVPEEIAAIQSALDVAVDGDTVLIAAGTYTGEKNKNLDFNGKAIVVRSADGPDSTVIDCEWNGRGFYFHSEEGYDSIVEGLTVKNGYQKYTHGRGILIEDSSPLIIDSNIQDCNSGYITRVGNVSIQQGNSSSILYNLDHFENRGSDGAGIYCVNSNMIVMGCVISGNVNDGMGGGIYVESSDIQIIDCLISDNSAFGEGGGIYSLYSTMSLLSNYKSNNDNCLQLLVSFMV